MINKTILFSFLFILNYNFTLSQCPDPSDIIRFETQTDVEEFLQTYPDCEQLGELEILRHVSDLSGLTNLKKLDYLYFDSLYQLPNLDGLENIDSIFGNLGFSRLLSFENLCGLHNLKHVGNDLRFEETENLKSLVGLENLITIGDDFTVDKNLDIISLNGVQNVTSLGSESPFITIQITDNPRLSDCCAIQNLIDVFPSADYVISDNGMNCMDSLEIVSLICDFDYVDCILSSTYESTVNNIHMYPNPTNDFLYIEDTQVAEQVLIYNMQGKLIKTYNTSTGKYNVSELNTGTYLILIKDSEQRLISSSKIFKS